MIHLLGLPFGEPGTLTSIVKAQVLVARIIFHYVTDSAVSDASHRPVGLPLSPQWSVQPRANSSDAPTVFHAGHRPADGPPACLDKSLIEKNFGSHRTRTLRRGAESTGRGLRRQGQPRGIQVSVRDAQRL